MMLHEPLLLREIACADSGVVIIKATPLRFIPIHSSAPLIGCVEPAIGPNRSRVNSPVPSGSAWQPA